MLAPRAERPKIAAALADLVEDTRRKDPANRARVDQLRDLSEVAQLSGFDALPGGWVRRTQGFEGMQSLQSGDVILVRDMSRKPVLSEVQEFASGATTSPYSHSMVAWRSPEGSVHFVESLEPFGLRITPATDALIRRRARIAVLRLADPVARQAAAARVEAQVPKLQQRGHVPYDSWLNDDDASRFNCAQMSRHLLGDAYPAQRSDVPTGLRDFTKRAGLQNVTNVLPGDYEKDGRFAMVAEAIQPQLLLRVRAKEAATSALIARKQEGDDGVLRSGIKGKAAETVAKWTHQLGVVHEFNDRIVGAALDFRADSKPLQQALTVFQERVRSLEGRPPTRNELAAEAARQLAS